MRYPRVLAALAVAVALGACAPGTRAASPAGASLTAASAPAPATVAASEADAPAADDPAGPRYALIAPTAKSPVVHTGDDWTLPAWVRPAPFTGFFSEDASPANHVPVRSIDVTWRQIAPTPDGPLDLNATGKAQGMRFEPLGEQLAASGPYWVRIFASGVDWAPAWVATTCHVKGIGPDYDHELHLPIWNDCVWSALRDTWRKLLIDTGVLADPDFRFAYVPGAFTWVEFDYDIISTAAARGLLTKDQYLTWYRHMLDDLAAIAGPQVGQLVFTGEDYPWGPFGGAENLLAAAAVGRGFGVRTGITEEFDFHLNETPAYGSRIEPDGHLTLTCADPTGLQAFATENECYRACGYHAKSLGYAIVHSNLKALQLQLNWLYVVPEDSYLSRYAAHWDWVRLELGQRPETAADAWADLRDAQDTSWSDEAIPGRGWTRRPWVRNLERWLVQVDAPGAVSRRSKADVHKADPTKENGTAYEGLRTDRASGNRSLAFRLDPRFLPGDAATPVLAKVTYLDKGKGSFRLRHPDGTTAAVTLRDSKKWRTATFALALRPDQSLPSQTDLWIDVSGKVDLNVRFVRVVRLSAPAG